MNFEELITEKHCGIVSVILKVVEKNILCQGSIKKKLKNVKRFIIKAN